MSGLIGPLHEQDVIAGSTNEGLDVEAEPGAGDLRSREIQRLFHFGPVVIATKRTIPVDRIADHGEIVP